MSSIACVSRYAVSTAARASSYLSDRYCYIPSVACLAGLVVVAEDDFVSNI